MNTEDMTRSLGIAMSQLSALARDASDAQRVRIDAAQHAIRVVCDELNRVEREQPGLFDGPQF